MIALEIFKSALYFTKYEKCYMVYTTKNVWCKHNWRNFWFNQHKRHKRFIVMDRDKTQLIGCNSITNWLLHFKKYFQLAFEQKNLPFSPPFANLKRHLQREMCDNGTTYSVTSCDVIFVTKIYFHNFIKANCLEVV